MTRVEDGQPMAGPMTGATWSQLENVNEHNMPPVLMSSHSVSADQNRPIVMLDADQEEQLTRLKRFDATEQAEEANMAAEQLLDAEEQDKDNSKPSAMKMSSAGGQSTLGGKWKFFHTHLGQPNPMLGQEWKSKQNNVSEENKQAVDDLVSQFEKMTGRSGAAMDQEPMRVSMPHQMFMTPLMGQQNPMLGQEWGHPNHFQEQNPPQMNGNNGLMILGSPLSAGIEQISNPHLSEIVSHCVFISKYFCDNSIFSINLV